MDGPLNYLAWHTNWTLKISLKRWPGWKKKRFWKWNWKIGKKVVETGWKFISSSFSCLSFFPSSNCLYFLSSFAAMFISNFLFVICSSNSCNHFLSFFCYSFLFSCRKLNEILLGSLNYFFGQCDFQFSAFRPMPLQLLDHHHFVGSTMDIKWTSVCLSVRLYVCPFVCLCFSNKTRTFLCT